MIAFGFFSSNAFHGKACRHFKANSHPWQRSERSHSRTSPAKGGSYDHRISNLQCQVVSEGLVVWVGYMYVRKMQHTPLKFNSSPLKIGNPKRKLIFQPSFFMGYVKFRGCTSLKKSMLYNFQRQNRCFLAKSTGHIYEFRWSMHRFSIWGNLQFGHDPRFISHPNGSNQRSNLQTKTS